MDTVTSFSRSSAILPHRAYIYQSAHIVIYSGRRKRPLATFDSLYTAQLKVGHNRNEVLSPNSALRVIRFNSMTRYS